MSLSWCFYKKVALDSAEMSGDNTEVEETRLSAHRVAISF
jgi:hypothetical protein